MPNFGPSSGLNPMPKKEIELYWVLRFLLLFCIPPGIGPMIAKILNLPGTVQVERTPFLKTKLKLRNETETYKLLPAHVSALFSFSLLAFSFAPTSIFLSNFGELELQL